MSKKTLLPEVANKYTLVTIRPGKREFKGFGLIDLRTITLEQADDLFKKGFPFLKLKAALTDLANHLENTTKSSENLKGTLENLDSALTDLHQLPGGLDKDNIPPPPTQPSIIENRKNKKALNFMLTQEWKDLSYTNKLVFFNDEAYFLQKKSRMIQNGDLQKEMVSVHAKMKALDVDEKFNPERADCMSFLQDKQMLKKGNWEFIDTWIDPVAVMGTSPDEIAANAIAQDKLIKAHVNFIWRNEKIVATMATDTESQRKKKASRVGEIKRRRQELIDFGQPYNRQERSK